MNEISSHLDEPATEEIPHLHAAKVIFLPEACCLYAVELAESDFGFAKTHALVLVLVSQTLP